ncbi:MAG: amidohydrolase family protein, partial [Gemmatimonadetes bacterium]|nr:amidohydrolase family protein [Gemmatimonadota bacterium]
MRRSSALGLLALALGAGAPVLRAQAPPSAPRATIVRAARLIDGVSDAVRQSHALLVEGDRILAVGPATEVARRAPAGAVELDLGDATLLPGLIDAHTHLLLQGDITQQDYDEQLLKESTPYRTIRATVAARTALLNGFTT